ncbi:KpsF/GutQ family sugar-phosphate isomerase [Aliiglaciecola sp. CAU 1673]|uniref:KpsF/GutQ family sugar-phosphate isomerase n=1 Tax=Aliiglaciecola sp. CAU 1673 TaxID=3032595 RepID=UPI0023DC2D21|nr:KpsF/GutQ family sugar-phosphate isomerase [Aliiglaciecola sp. CAU 1673]MDF2178298.1 KpsF/GutQ family sugar-phosphate isomerase [Aliiglaciecola sp. CAU 1673]
MNYQAIAQEVFEIEAQAVKALSDRLNPDFSRAIDIILNAKGRVVVCGMGKSGIIGKKIAATFASTGTPSFFMHPGEAYHGDLGMIAKEDVFIAISNSGETDEVVKLLPFIKENGNVLIGMTGEAGSSLANAADVVLDVGVDKEACPLQLAPTASTTATLAMGDALAVTLMKVRDFQPEEFARFHPGGSLGRRLLARVKDEMVQHNLPLIAQDASFAEVVDSITRGQLGIAVVDSESGYGIVTDGDIRRAFAKFRKDVFDFTAKEMMTLNPKSIDVNAKMADAFAIMETRHITSLLVLEEGRLVGIVKK